MAEKAREIIKSYLNQCGDLDYGEFIDFLDSVVFKDEAGQGIAPICQVTRYMRFLDVNSTITINGLFNRDTNLVGVYVFRKSGGNFTLKIGTTNGGVDLVSVTVDKPKLPLDILELFENPTTLYLSGFDANVCDVVVVYNSFLCDDNGEISMGLIEELQESIINLTQVVIENKEDLQTQINNLSNALIQIPPGIVVEWPGPVSAIPNGWELFLGDVDRFVIPAGGKYSPGETGGAETHTLTIEEMPEHGHPYGRSEGGTDYGNGSTRPSNNNLFEANTGATGGSMPHNNMPPFIARNFIIKV